MNLDGRTALITGGARRVGRAIALALAQEGADIALHYHRSDAEARRTAEEIQSLGRRAGLWSADLADAAAVQAMISKIETQGSGIDILVNSASIFYRTPFQSLTLPDWETNLGVNLRAPFQLALAFGRAMKVRGCGKIINIADSAVRRPYPDYLPYLVSKSGLIGLTEALALELAPEVQVNAIAPGTVMLPEDASDAMTKGIIRRTPLGRIGQPEDVARLVLHLVRDGDFATGSTYFVDGGSALGRG